MNKYSVLKLSNGEDIVCRVVEASKERIKIEDPLLLDVQQITDEDGRIKESVGLLRWIKPFTEEEEYFNIPAERTVKELRNIIEKRYHPDAWNIYSFHCSDGDNWADDVKKSVERTGRGCCD